MKRPKIRETLTLIVRLIALTGIIFLVYFLFFRNSNSNEIVLEDTPLKVEQIKSILELNAINFQDEVVVDSVEYYQNMGEAFSGTLEKLFDINQLKNSLKSDGIKRRLTLIVRGNLMYGVDLKKKDFQFKTYDDSTILILPEPELLSIETNPANTEVYIENGYWKDSERIILMNLARKRMIQTADELHLKEKVKKPIEKLLHVLNASNKKLIIQYRSL